jgi:hypothetical protein
VVVDCSGNRHVGYTVSLLFLNLSRQSQERLSALAALTDRKRDFGMAPQLHGYLSSDLQTAIDGGASDVHVKVGGPVIFRINRQLIAIEAPVPTMEWMEDRGGHMVPKHLKTRLLDEKEVDFSYFVPGLGRFRTNLFPTTRRILSLDAVRQRPRCPVSRSWVCSRY